MPNLKTATLVKQIQSLTLAKSFIVSMLNTLIGWSSIALLMLLNLSPQLSNIIGYALGLCIAFLLNRFWVFLSGKSTFHAQIPKFLGAFMVAYACNFLMLNLLLLQQINPWIAQLSAAITYTVIFYVLNKELVFK